MKTISILLSMLIILSIWISPVCSIPIGAAKVIPAAPEKQVTSDQASLGLATSRLPSGQALTLTTSGNQKKNDYVIVAYNLTSPPSYMVTESGQKLYVVRINSQVAYVDANPNANDLNQMLSIRLQTSMDQYSKALQTISNVMKTISNTQDTIAQNLK
jgi:hypothetical protein